MKILILILCFSSMVYSAVLEKQGDKFRFLKSSFNGKELLEDYARLKGLNIREAHPMKEQYFELFGPTTMSESQLDAYVSRAISLSDSALIVDPSAPFVQVIEARDARYTPLPVYEDETKVPDNDNFIQFNHRLKYAEASDMSRNLRPFLSRYGRVIDVPHARSVHFADSGNNVRRLIAIAKIIDVPSYENGKKEIEEINEKHRKILRKEKSVSAIIVENQGMFFIIFLILGLILGFGVRGYLMKRVEGGW